MKKMNEDEVKRLVKDPVSFAMMMNNDQIEHVIVMFVSVLINQKQNQGGKN